MRLDGRRAEIRLCLIPRLGKEDLRLDLDSVDQAVQFEERLERWEIGDADAGVGKPTATVAMIVTQGADFSSRLSGSTANRSSSWKRMSIPEVHVGHPARWRTFASTACVFLRSYAADTGTVTYTVRGGGKGRVGLRSASDIALVSFGASRYVE